MLPSPITPVFIARAIQQSAWLQDIIPKHKKPGKFVQPGPARYLDAISGNKEKEKAQRPTLASTSRRPPTRRMNGDFGRTPIQRDSPKMNSRNIYI